MAEAMGLASAPSIRASMPARAFSVMSDEFYRKMRAYRPVAFAEALAIFTGRLDAS